MRLIEIGTFYVPDDVMLQPNQLVTFGSAFIDAADEGFQIVGQIVFDDLTSGPKTISSAGGKIVWVTPTSTSVFDDGGTILRVGLQDIDTSGATIIGDGVFDVYTDLTGGVDTIGTIGLIEANMATGSKSLAHGQYVSVMWYMIARGGTDNFRIGTASANQVYSVPRLTPIVHSKTGADWAINPSVRPLCYLQFDDGSLGWLYGQYNYGHRVSFSSFAEFNLNTATGDEYGNVFTLEEYVRVTGFFGAMTVRDNADFEINCYRDPLTSPELIHSHPVDNRYVAKGQGAYSDILFNTPFDLAPGTYALTIRPITTNNVQVVFSSRIHNDLWRTSSAGANPAYAVRRVDNAGAFSAWMGELHMFPLHLECSHRGQVTRAAISQLGG